VEQAEIARQEEAAAQESLKTAAKEPSIDEP